VTKTTTTVDDLAGHYTLCFETHTPGALSYLHFHILSAFRQWISNWMFNLMLVRPVLYYTALVFRRLNQITIKVFGWRKNTLHRAVHGSCWFNNYLRFEKFSRVANRQNTPFGSNVGQYNWDNASSTI